VHIEVNLLIQHIIVQDKTTRLGINILGQSAIISVIFLFLNLLCVSSYNLISFFSQCN